MVLLSEVAAVAGCNLTVLKDRAGDVEIELRPVTEYGQLVRRPFVKDGEEWRPLRQYAE